MSEKITNTLFRFTTLRAPQLINEDHRIYFAKIPSSNSSSFVAAVASSDPADVRTDLETEATTFEGTATNVWTEDEILSNDASLPTNINDLYTFSKWLMRNQSTLTDTEVTNNLGGASSLSGTDLDDLWDNFFYQNIRMNDLRMREILTRLIVASHFIDNWQDAFIDSDEKRRRLAKSHVVIPKNMWQQSANFLNDTTKESTFTGSTAVFDKHMAIAHAKIKSDIYEKARRDIRAYKKTYGNVKISAVKSANNTFDTSVKSSFDTIVSNGSYVYETKTDPFTNIAFDKCLPDDHSYPTMDYSSVPPEIEQAEIEANVSDESITLFSEENFYADYNTLGEFESKIDEMSRGEMDFVFSNTEFQNVTLGNGDVEFSTCALENRYNQERGFHIKPIRKSLDKHGFVMVLNVGDPCVKIKDLSYTVEGSINDTFETFEATNSHGIMTIDMNPGTSLAISDATSSIDVSGTITLNNGHKLSWSSSTVDMEKGLYGVLSESSIYSDSSERYIPSSFGLKRLGISDYRKVEATLCAYEPGEVSHIENILAKEYKERSTRRLRRSEDTTSESSETETEFLTDTQTSTRFDMSSEASQIIAETRDKSTSVNVYASASKQGKISLDSGVDVGVNFATSNSKESSNSQATNFAKDITNQASERLATKVQRERVLKVIEEFEETNRHGFDNRLGNTHISGVYRWVDKIYLNEIYNFGKRLQYEFMIPEPSAFHHIAKRNMSQSLSFEKLVRPLDPRESNYGVLKPIKSAGEINDSNYRQWAAVYNAVVSPPPDEKVIIGETFSKSQASGDGGEDTNKAESKQVLLPKGYGIEHVFVSTVAARGHVAANVAVSVADVTKRFLWPDGTRRLLITDDAEKNYDKYIDSVPVAVYFEWVWVGSVNISLELKRKPSHYAQWQLDTFNAIISAYEDQLESYKERKAELEARKSQILADNPAYYREIEQLVLKKNCISYLVGHLNMGQKYIDGEELSTQYVTQNAQMESYSSLVKFIEQAFEWEIMNYSFYPFYWANKDNWSELYNVQNDDPTFKAFMQAGMGRVQVSVRPGFENAVMHYMETGQVWNGGDAPIIDDDLYLSIADEILDPEGYIEASWKTRVPSTLTLVQKDTVSLDATGLPSYCDDIQNPPTETIANDTTTLSGLKVYVDGYTDPETPPA